MKPIVTPVFRPTEDSIWNSFRATGKRHLILTGGRGSGKTTLLRKLCPEALPGITTYAQPGQAVYLMENLTGRRAKIGAYDESLPGPENRMRLCQEGFETLGIEALKRCINAENEWAVIDEIGYLECGCAEYQDAVRQLMAKKGVIAAVRKQDAPFLREICGREDVFVADLDDPYGNAGCVIMASGVGKRFGGNKLMADFHGEPLFMRALRATEGIFARRTVVTRHASIASMCRDMGVDAVLHDLPSRSDTVRLGLDAMKGVDRCLFCPGDQPLLNRETVAAIALAGASGGENIWRASFGKTNGTPVLFPKWAFEALCHLPEGKGGGYVINRHPEMVRAVSVREEAELMDVDSPEDLQTLLNMDSELHRMP